MLLWENEGWGNTSSGEFTGGFLPTGKTGLLSRTWHPSGLTADCFSLRIVFRCGLFFASGSICSDEFF